MRYAIGGKDMATGPDNTLLFSDETRPQPVPAAMRQAEATPQHKPWKIIIADDEEEVHTMTRMVLRKFSFENRSVELISTYSGEETLKVMAEQPDVSIILLDVVMETENSGLEVVRQIREHLKNPFVRIILRTGQPGQAPEDDVIRNYDINDYKSKTELTVQKLYTSIIASLRAYMDMRTIERNRQGLEMILKQARSLFQLKTLEAFMGSALDTYERLLQLEPESAGARINGFGAIQREQKFRVISRKGAYRNDPEKTVERLSSEFFRDMAHQAEAQEGEAIREHSYLSVFRREEGLKNYIYFESPVPITESERALFQILNSNIGVAIDNIYLNNEIIDTQKEVLYTLGEIVEFRSKETANHVSRVAEYSYVLALEYGLSEEEASLLRMASPMHDIGKIGIPDTILTKPGKLTPEEFEVIKTHTTIGYEILKQSKRDIMKMAARLALEHHERWDGSGYPHGKKRDEIHIMSRITCLADVYDALSHKRVYKEAWTEEMVDAEILKMREIMFEPRLVDIFFRNKDRILEIRNRLPD